MSQDEFIRAGLANIKRSNSNVINTSIYNSNGLRISDFMSSNFSDPESMERIYKFINIPNNIIDGIKAALPVHGSNFVRTSSCMN